MTAVPARATVVIQVEEVDPLLMQGRPGCLRMGRQGPEQGCGTAALSADHDEAGLLEPQRCGRCAQLLAGPAARALERFRRRLANGLQGLSSCWLFLMAAAWSWSWRYPASPLAAALAVARCQTTSPSAGAAQCRTPPPLRLPRPRAARGRNRRPRATSRGRRRRAACRASAARVPSA